MKKQRSQPAALQTISGKMMEEKTSLAIRGFAKCGPFPVVQRPAFIGITASAIVKQSPFKWRAGADRGDSTYRQALLSKETRRPMLNIAMAATTM